MPHHTEEKNSDFDVCCECKHSCCQDAKPPLTKEGMQNIQGFLEHHGRSIDKVFVTSDYSFPSVDSEEFCVFNDKKTKLCTVHEVKPETCRAGPVTFDINRRTLKVEWFLKTRELCPFAGKLFDNPEKLNLHLKVAKEEIMKLICELDDTDLRAILARDEPQTFKIGEDPLPNVVSDKLGLK